jgi:hypothetical protein
MQNYTGVTSDKHIIQEVRYAMGIKDEVGGTDRPNKSRAEGQGEVDASSSVG